MRRLQVLPGKGAIHQCGNRIGPLAVPEMVEHVRYIAHHGAHGHDIQIPEIGVRVDGNVMVTDVSATDNGKAVVHAVVDAIHVDGKIQHLGATVGKGIEDAYLDIGMGIHRGNVLVACADAHVIDQQAYPHPAVGCPDQAIREDAAGRVSSPPPGSSRYGH